MRLAWVTVGSALAGTTLVLTSIGSTAAPPAIPPEAPPVATPAPAPVVLERQAGACPPCQGAPLDADAWAVQLATLDGAVALERAAALSITLPDARSISAALAGDDPSMRSLAALLLNVGSRRVPSCQSVGSVSVLQLLERFDGLALAAKAGERPSAVSLAASTAQAELVNRGAMPGCD